MASHAFVTLLTSDSYLAGALVAAHSIKTVEKNSTRKFDLVCLITLDSISVESIKTLRKVYSLVISVDDIRSSHCEKELNLLGRQDLSSTVTKIHLWRLVQYEKLIYLDADTLLLKSISHLFDLDEPFSACADIGWPDCFNSGLMVIRPSEEVFEKLYEHFLTCGSWDGGDQGLLNEFFNEGSRQSSSDEPGPAPGWNRLSFVYNVTPSAYYSYAPAYKRYGDKISMIHFIGQEKPWHLINRRRYRNPRSYGQESAAREAVDYDSLVNKWFDAYEEAVGPIGQLEWEPSLSEFKVPKYASQWDSSQPSAYQPPTLEELKEMFKLNRGPSHLEFHQLQPGDGEGSYVSFLLPVRFRALREKYQGLANDRTAQEQADSKNHMQEPNQDHHEHRETWDASRSPPPAEGYQMNQPMTQHYESAWDNPNDKRTRSFFKPAPTNHPIGFIPAVTHQDYSQFSSVPRPDNVGAIFPWESRSRHQAGRVFPEEETSYVFHGEERGRQQGQSTNWYSSDAPSEGPHSHSPPPASQSASLSQIYRNAWDEDPMIGRWAQARQSRSGEAATGSSGWDQLEQTRATLARTPHLELKSFMGTDESLGDGREGGTGAGKESVVGNRFHLAQQGKPVTLSYRMRRDSENSSQDADEEDVGEDDDPASVSGSPKTRMTDEEGRGEGGLSAEEVAGGQRGFRRDRIRPELYKGNGSVGSMSRLPTMRSMIIGLPVRVRESVRGSRMGVEKETSLKEHYVRTQKEVKGLEIMQHGGARHDRGV